MLTSLALFGLGFLPTPQGLPNAPVVINEFQYDEYAVAPDQQEFVELYNRSGAPVNIGGWTVTNHDAALPAIVYTIPANTVLPAGGFWVLGSASVPNVNQILTPQTPNTELLLNNNQSITLRDTTNVIIDTVFYEANKAVFNATLAEGQAIWGNFQSTPGRDSSWSRMRDGYDTGDNGRDFRTVSWTPGLTNNQPNLLPYLAFYDSNNVGDLPPEFGASFKQVRVIDPTLVDTYNRNAILPSPQGGKAILAYDETGGGNSNMLLSDVQTDWVFEAYVYFDAVPEVAGEYESFSIGVAGTTCSLFNTPDPSRTLLGVPSACGNTGVCWTYQVTSTGAKLYLVDHNDGGTDDVVLGTITIQQGVNDGWQRLRLESHGNRVEGRFGGSYGVADGSVLFGTLSAPAPGGFYIGYREFVTLNATLRPPTLDFVSIRNSIAGVDEIGTATPTTSRTPVLSTNGFPLVGNAGFALQSSGLVPNNPSAIIVGATLLPTPIDLQLLGGQAGSKVYESLDVVVSLVNSASGTTTLPLAVPNLPVLIGGALYAQHLDVDLGLGIPLPVGNSTALKLTLGN